MYVLYVFIALIRIANKKREKDNLIMLLVTVGGLISSVEICYSHKYNFSNRATIWFCSVVKNEYLETILTSVKEWKKNA